MITYGIIALAVGLVLSVAGFTLHFINMMNLIDGDGHKITGLKVILPFAFICIGGVGTIVGAALLFL